MSKWAAIHAYFMLLFYKKPMIVYQRQKPYEILDKDKFLEEQKRA